jgi:hypothetical protein
MKKYTAFGREFEGSPVRFKGVAGYHLSAKPVVGDRGWLQKFWCPKHVFELLYTEVKDV